MKSQVWFLQKPFPSEFPKRMFVRFTGLLWTIAMVPCVSSDTMPSWILPRTLFLLLIIIKTSPGAVKIGTWQLRFVCFYTNPLCSNFAGHLPMSESKVLSNGGQAEVDTCQAGLAPREQQDGWWPVAGGHYTTRRPRPVELSPAGGGRFKGPRSSDDFWSGMYLFMRLALQLVNSPREGWFAWARLHEDSNTVPLNRVFWNLSR